MPLTQEIIDRFFAQASDVHITGEEIPHTSSGNRVEYLIDGENYFSALSDEIGQLQTGAGFGRFFYFADWWAGLVETPAPVGSAGPAISAWFGTDPGPNFTPFILGKGCGSQTGTLLIDQLTSLATDHDVDVRGLVWMSPVVMNEFAGALAPGSNLLGEIYWTGRAHSIRSAQTLRSRIGEDRVMLNVLAHPLGSWHVKMVVCGDDTGIRAYAGGMDLVCDKYSETTHPPENKWHDAAARIQGPAALAIFDYFQQIWDEQRGRGVTRFLINGSEVPSHYSTTLAPTTAPVSLTQVSNVGTQSVQVLRTSPKTSISFPSTVTDAFGKILLFTTGQQPLSFAPDGQFQFRMALKKAISGAQSYIYIEDQSFVGQEIMGWLNAQLLQMPALKVIMVWGADPGDPPNIFIKESMRVLTANLTDASNRIVFCHYHDVTVHAKIFIIDDLWATVGSCNCARRSLYLDAEINVGILDDGASTFAQQLRKDLWAEHCDIKPATPEADQLLPLDQALGMWEPTWATSPLPQGVARKSALERKNIPFEFADNPGPGQWGKKFNDRAFFYDFFDGDSR